MIKLVTSIPYINNDIADVIRLFYSFEKITYDKDDDADIAFFHTHTEEEGIWREKIVFTEGVINNETEYTYTPADVSDELRYKRHLKRSAMLAFYRLIKSITGKNLPWGALTGIRPTQFYRSLDIETKGTAGQKLISDYDVSLPKVDLMESIIHAQEGIYNKDTESGVDLYIGIPFCPTRCEYCSFISYDMSKGGAPLEAYTKALIKEIKWFNDWKEKNKRFLRSVYIGGGTPTAIDMDLLEKIISEIDIAKGTEFTVEAGRPDTISPLMLRMLYDKKVTRISINPQSMNDETLLKMKRPHTARDIVSAFNMARRYDWTINMDMILGLEGETMDMLSHTLDEVAKLDIDNLTVHTLAVKRASKLKENIAGYNFTGEDVVTHMVDLAHARAYVMGMRPYYMYRQKYMSGNLENVGFAKENKECIYNIDIMEETHNLIALGAGAVSKRQFYSMNRHERLGNHKSVAHYIDNIDEQLLKKDDFFAYN